MKKFLLNDIGSMPNSTIGTDDGINIWLQGSLKGKLSPKWSIEDIWVIPQKWCRIIFEMNTVLCWGSQTRELRRELCKVCNYFYRRGQKDINKQQEYNKIDNSWKNEYYTSAGKGEHHLKNGDKKNMDLEVNFKSGDYRVYRLAKSCHLTKM